jgi:hypothetical protein
VCQIVQLEQRAQVRTAVGGGEIGLKRDRATPVRNVRTPCLAVVARQILVSQAKRHNPVPLEVITYADAGDGNRLEALKAMRSAEKSAAGRAFQSLVDGSKMTQNVPFTPEWMFTSRGAFRGWLLRILIDQAFILREKEPSTSNGKTGNRHNYQQSDTTMLRAKVGML